MQKNVDNIKVMYLLLVIINRLVKNVYYYAKDEIQVGLQVSAALAFLIVVLIIIIVCIVLC